MTSLRRSSTFSVLTVAVILLSLHPADSVAGAEPEPLAESPISDSDREHWAFQPIVRPNLPEVKEGGWARTEVDRFVLAKLETKQLTPAAEASRATLLRRLAFDLTGLPPTTDEVAAFVGDPSADAYERQVERLLASPAYGERWAQHWLDLARFAETDGFEHDKVRREAWQYRDWVIAALNADLPYDRFASLQLAGDLIAKDDPSAAVATHFTLAGPDMPDINDQLERRHNLLNEVTSTVGSVFLGLQLGCAQCHDHKYDPLSQGDFYRLRAVFEPAVSVLKRDVPYNFLKEQEKTSAARFWVRGDHRRPGPEVAPGFPRIAEAPASAKTSSEQEARPRSRRDFAQWLFRRENPLTARVMVNRVWQHHFGRGLFPTPSDVGIINEGPTHPELLDWLAVEFRAQGWSLKQLHRLIVGSATYRQASRDDLSSPSPASGRDVWKQRFEVDPANDLYSRFPRRRLDGESLRDAMLTAGGLLSGERGGPGVMPPLPPELVKTLLGGQWTASQKESDHYRRSIYLFARRNLRFPIFEAFDRPDANASCAVRSRSTTAPQSLSLLNSDFSLLAARHLAGRIMRESCDPRRQIERLYEHALGRSATEVEVASMTDFLNAERERLKKEARPRDRLALPAGCPAEMDGYSAAALVDACLALLNASEFLYVD